tara:strand:- start:2251 stop:2673 length:423 start_codon:yes stop_codon:yes gene_type:complete
MEGTKFKNIYEGEYMISELIKCDNGCYTNFDYDSVYQGGTNTSLKVITYNPSHKTHFLLHQINGIDALDTLHKMFDHLYNIKDNANYVSYVVEWLYKDIMNINRSLFYGENTDEIMKKFYYRKRKDDYTMLSIRLNPETK